MAFVYWIHLKEHIDITTQGYIGVSIDPEGRLYEHKRLWENKKHDNIHLQRAANKYQDLAYSILCEANEEYCYMIENKLRPIAQIGWNISPGGAKPPNRTGFRHTPETRAIISETSRRPCSEDKKLKISAKNKNTKRTLEQRQRMSNTAKTRTPTTDATRFKMSVAQAFRHSARSA